MTITISTSPEYYGQCTDDEAERIAHYIVIKAIEYIKVNDLDATVAITDTIGTGLSAYADDDERRVDAYIEDNWVGWLPEALA